MMNPLAKIAWLLVPFRNRPSFSRVRDRSRPLALILKMLDKVDIRLLWTNLVLYFQFSAVKIEHVTYKFLFIKQFANHRNFASDAN